MIVRVRPLTADLVERLAELARTEWDRDGFDEFCRVRGWAESRLWSGFDTESGHQLVPADPDWSGGRQSRFFLPFVLVDTEVDPTNDFDLDDGWETVEETFDQAWDRGCTVVSDVFGAPEQIIGGDWNFAVWGIGTAALVVAQGEEFTSYGQTHMAAVWLVGYPSGPRREGEAFYDWLLGAT